MRRDPEQRVHGPRWRHRVTSSGTREDACKNPPTCSSAYLYNKITVGNPNRRLGRRLQIRFRPLGGEDSSVGYTLNISATGMFVATIRPLPPGTRLDVEVRDKQRSLRLNAVVIHARKVPATWQRIHPSGMGLRFLDPTAKSENLRELVGRSSSLWY